jgi:hypothetical protein
MTMGMRVFPENSVLARKNAAASPMFRAPIQATERWRPVPQDA